MRGYRYATGAFNHLDRFVNDLLVTLLPRSEFGADGGNRTLTLLRETDFLTTSAFAAFFSSWSGSCLHHSLTLALGAARLISTPSSNDDAWLGVTIARGFTEFEQFYSKRFRLGTP